MMCWIRRAALSRSGVTALSQLNLEEAKAQWIHICALITTAVPQIQGQTIKGIRESGSFQFRTRSQTHGIEQRRGAVHYPIAAPMLLVDLEQMGYRSWRSTCSARRSHCRASSSYWNLMSGDCANLAR